MEQDTASLNCRFTLPAGLLHGALTLSGRIGASRLTLQVGADRNGTATVLLLSEPECGEEA